MDENPQLSNAPSSSRQVNPGALESNERKWATGESEDLLLKYSTQDDNQVKRRIESVKVKWNAGTKPVDTRK